MQFRELGHIAATVRNSIDRGRNLGPALAVCWEETSGIKITPGRLKINAGRFKDETVEPGQRKLSNFLIGQICQPEKFKGGAAARKLIARRTGIASFYQLQGGGNQGHIDLVSVQDWPDVLCSGSCYGDSLDVWFWPLK